MRNILLYLLVLLSPLVAHSTTYYVDDQGSSDSNPGTSAQPFATIQRGINAAGAGDTIIVRPGTYAGGKFSSSGTTSLPITLRGETGAIVNSVPSQNTNGDGLWIRNASHIVIEGFEIHSTNRSGIAVQGEPTAEVLGIVLRNNHCHNNFRWGIFTGYAKGILIENNTTTYSGQEHGIYVSNSSDDPVIRGNVVHHNHASGIQINADPALAGDGIITNAVIDSNIVYENGTGGGAAINLASVRNSLIVNNLLYQNHSTGIAGWDDGFDPAFGTQNNSLYNNTIVQASGSRWAISLLNGSKNNRIKNNILLHLGTRGAINIDDSSEVGLDSNFNVVKDLFSIQDGAAFISLNSWRARGSGHDQNSIISNSASLFVDPGAANFHLKTGSPAINSGTTLPQVTDDLEGQARPSGSGYDAGAYEFNEGGPGPDPDPDLYFEDFEDGQTGGWAFSGGSWQVVSGDLRGTGKKGRAFSPNFGACSLCTFESRIAIQTVDGKAAMLAWYQDSKNYVEFQLLELKNKIMVKHVSAGTVRAKKSTARTITPGAQYYVKITYTGSSFLIYFEDPNVPAMTLATPVTPTGNAGFRMWTGTTSVTANLEEIRVTD